MAKKVTPKKNVETGPKEFTRTIKAGTVIEWFDGLEWHKSPPLTRDYTTKGIKNPEAWFEFVATIQGRARTCSVDWCDTENSDYEPKAFMRTFVNPTETGWVINTAQERFYVSLFGELYNLSGYLNASAPYRFAVSFFHTEGDDVAAYIEKAKAESRARMQIAITSINELLNLNPE